MNSKADVIKRLEKINLIPKYITIKTVNAVLIAMIIVNPEPNFRIKGNSQFEFDMSPKNYEFLRGIYGFNFGENILGLMFREEDIDQIKIQDHFPKED